MTKGLVMFTCTGHHKLSGQPEDAVVHVELDNDGSRSFICRNHHLQHNNKKYWVSLKASLFSVQCRLRLLKVGGRCQTSESRHYFGCGAL